jgi:hypothetical protein
MVKFQNSFREYILDEIRPIRNSAHIGNIVFEIKATYKNMFCHRQTSEIVLVYPHMNPLTLNGKQYKIETNDDVLAFHSVLEAAALEDILNDENNSGKQEGI